jgi:Ni,Fe-hydrogenase I cytochrome b subunit
METATSLQPLSTALNTTEKPTQSARGAYLGQFLSTLWAISETVRYLPPYQSDIEAHDRAPVNSLSTNNILHTHTHRLIMWKISGHLSSHVFFVGANILVAIRCAGARPT